ncbi:MAG: hypothetical protein ABJP34_08520 [Erythrobacter sp.]
MTRESSKNAVDAAVMDGVRGNLARDDHALASVVPVLAHVLAHPGEPLVSDEVIARMRGLFTGIAREFPTSVDVAATDAFATVLTENGDLISHCYAAGVEGAITQSLSENHGIDPALPALVQELIGSKDAQIAELAMAFMIAQSRFAEGQRRNTANLFELPPELFDAAVSAWCAWADEGGFADINSAETKLRSSYDEGSTRLGLINGLLSAIGGGSQVFSEIETAGLAMFASAIAKDSGQPRELVILSCQTQQSLRLALTLKASSRSSEAILRQFAFVGRGIALPPDFDEWSAEQASDILAASPLSARASSHG